MARRAAVESAGGEGGAGGGAGRGAPWGAVGEGDAAGGTTWGAAGEGAGLRAVGAVAVGGADQHSDSSGPCAFLVRVPRPSALAAVRHQGLCLLPVEAAREADAAASKGRAVFLFLYDLPTAEGPARAGNARIVGYARVRGPPNPAKRAQALAAWGDAEGDAGGDGGGGGPHAARFGDPLAVQWLGDVDLPARQVASLVRADGPLASPSDGSRLPPRVVEGLLSLLSDRGGSRGDLQAFPGNSQGAPALQPGGFGLAPRLLPAGGGFGAGFVPQLLSAGTAQQQGGTLQVQLPGGFVLPSAAASGAMLLATGPDGRLTVVQGGGSAAGVPTAMGALGTAPGAGMPVGMGSFGTAPGVSAAGSPPPAGVRPSDFVLNAQGQLVAQQGFGQAGLVPLPFAPASAAALGSAGAVPFLQPGAASAVSSGDGAGGRPAVFDLSGALTPALAASLSAALAADGGSQSSHGAGRAGHGLPQDARFAHLAGAAFPAASAAASGASGGGRGGVESRGSVPANGRDGGPARDALDMSYDEYLAAFGAARRAAATAQAEGDVVHVSAGGRSLLAEGRLAASGGAAGGRGGARGDATTTVADSSPAVPARGTAAAARDRRATSRSPSRSRSQSRAASSSRSRSPSRSRSRSRTPPRRHRSSSRSRSVSRGRGRKTWRTAGGGGRDGGEERSRSLAGEASPSTSRGRSPLHSRTPRSRSRSLRRSRSRSSRSRSPLRSRSRSRSSRSRSPASSAGEGGQQEMMSEEEYIEVCRAYTSEKGLPFDLETVKKHYEEMKREAGID